MTDWCVKESTCPNCREPIDPAKLTSNKYYDNQIDKMDDLVK